MRYQQLQELAQRSCFSMPSYVCTREGPDHAPRFRAAVTFNGETFEGPSGCTTLRQAEHAAAEVALASISLRGPSTLLAARVLDETGVYKNLLQETAHRAGLKLPAYTTVRSGPGHSPVFSSTVEVAGMSFAGDSARTKKQAEKNAAMAAWSSLKQNHFTFLQCRRRARSQARAPPAWRSRSTWSSPECWPRSSRETTPSRRQSIAALVLLRRLRFRTRSGLGTLPLRSHRGRRLRTRRPARRYCFPCTFCGNRRRAPGTPRRSWCG